MSTEPPKGLLRRPARVFYGWWIVAISLAVETLIQGVYVRGFSLYFIPVQKELGISRAAYSLAEMLGRLGGAAQGPAVGYLIHRLGPRTMMVAGGALSGLGFILLSFTQSYWYFLLIFVGLLSMAYRASYNNASVPAINYWFRRKRSLAISIMYNAQGLGGLAITPMVGLMVVGLGWRESAFISGIVILAVVVPLSLLVRRSPESMGLLPDGAPAQPLPKTEQPRLGEVDPAAPEPFKVHPDASQPAIDADFTPGEAMRTSSYWLLVLAVSIRNSMHIGVLWHLVPLLVWSGVNTTTAALFVAVISFHLLAFTLCVGWMGDRWSKRRICSVSMVTGGLALVVLMRSGGDLALLTLFAILWASSEATLPVTWAMMGDFFGPKAYPILRGWLQPPMQLMAMTTPVWVGWVFDRTDSYSWALVLLAIMLGLAALVYWTLPIPTRPSRTSKPSELLNDTE